MGKWLYQKKLDHECSSFRPSGTNMRGASIGDIWQCDCGKVWIFEGYRGNNLNEYASWSEFHGEVPKQKTVESRGDDSGIYAPGTK